MPPRWCNTSNSLPAPRCAARPWFRTSTIERQPRSRAVSDDRQMRDAACIVGVGNTGYGNFPETDAYGLGAEALTKALDDAGLKLSDIDGLLVGRIPSYERFSEMIGL